MESDLSANLDDFRFKENSKALINHLKLEQAKDLAYANRTHSV